MNLQELTGKESVVGVFLGGKILKCGRVKDGVLEKNVTIKINNKDSEENVIKEVISAIGEVMDETVKGIGIGVPSLVDVKKGIVYKAVNIPSWREVHLREILEDRFKIRVYVNNDANCYAIGEKYFGRAQSFSNIVGLIIGAGMGAGVIFNGHLYSGANCGAGEYGSIPYREHDFEYYCSEAYFEEKYGLRFDDLYERAENKDKIALAIFEQYGFDLGNAIKVILYSVDPEYIVLGGDLSKAFPFFQKGMMEKVQQFPYKHALKKLKIEPTDNPNIAVLGAAALYFDAQNRTLRK